MKFTLSWLKEYLDTDVSIYALSECMTAIGLEVESVEDPAKKLAPFTIAHVIKAVQHPNADKLRLCTVDTGGETVQVVCGADDLFRWHSRPRLLHRFLELDPRLICGRVASRPLLVHGHLQVME